MASIGDYTSIVVLLKRGVGIPIHKVKVLLDFPQQLVYNLRM